jgi:hypothetical protein
MRGKVAEPNFFRACADMLSPVLSMCRGGEGLPDLPIPGIFLQHALRMKLKSYKESSFRIIVGLD